MIKDELTVVLTDSGLGGLSIAAELYERLKSGKNFRRARIIFFNCRPSNTLGFDPMETDEQRHRVFSNALYAMDELFSPDVILIACNTLTVFSHHTPFAQKTAIPMRGVVGHGVDMMAEYLDQNPGAKVVLFGTKTTVRSGMHKRLLIEKGFSKDRFFYQKCRGLANSIEHGATCEQTRSLLAQYTGEAAERLAGHTGQTAAALLCTHFGYSTELFREGMSANNIQIDSILNPNTRMVDSFLKEFPGGNFPDSLTTIEVFTQSEHPADSKESIGSLTAKISEDAANALCNDCCIPGMFDIS